MRKMKKSVCSALAFILAAAMVMGIMPADAFMVYAAEETDAVKENLSDDAAENAEEAEKSGENAADDTEAERPMDEEDETADDETVWGEPEDGDSNESDETEELREPVEEEQADLGVFAGIGASADEVPTVVTDADGLGGSVAWSDGKTVTWKIADDKNGVVSLSVSGSGNCFTCSENTFCTALDSGEDSDIARHIPWYANRHTFAKAEINLCNSTNWGYMFYGCGSLKTVDLTGSDSSTVTNMKGMFKDCPVLKTLDLSDLDTSNVTDAQEMFYRCTGLSFLNLSGCDLGKLENDSSRMLESVIKAVIMAPIHLNKTVKLDDCVTWKDTTGGTHTYLPKNQNESIMLIPSSSASNPDVIKAISLDQSSLKLWHNTPDKHQAKYPQKRQMNAVLTIKGDPVDTSENWDPHTDDVTRMLLWESSDPSVAAVSAGVVTAVAKGTATITAKSLFNSEVAAACTVVVDTYAAPYFRIDRSSIDLELDPPSVVTASADIIPGFCKSYIEDADMVSFTSSDETVAAVAMKTRAIEEDGISKTIYYAEVTGLKEGEATVTAAFRFDGDLHTVKTCDITVRNKPADSVGINWSIDQGVLKVTGSGEIHTGAAPDHPYEDIPWYTRRTEITKAEISVKNCRDMSYLFYDHTNLEYVSFPDTDAGMTTDISHMFEGCTNFKGDPEEGRFIRGQYTFYLNSYRKLRDASCLFKGCTSLENVEFDIYSGAPELATTASMFEDCSGAEYIRFSLYNDDALKNVRNMFKGCTDLQTLNLSSFRPPASVTGTEGFLDGVSCVLHVSYDVEADIALPDGWTDRDGTVYTKLPRAEYEVFLYGPGCRVHQGTVGNISWFIDKAGTLTVNGTGDYFEDGAAHTKENVPWYAYRDEIKDMDIDLAEATDLSYMFYGCTNLEGMHWFGDIDLTDVRSMKGMFEDCTKLEAVGFYYYGNVDPVLEDLSDMLKNCRNLYGADLTSLHFGSVTDLSGMFEGCSSMVNVKLADEYSTRFDTSQVTDMSRMFKGCSALKDVNTARFDTGSVTDMSGMFEGCSSLIQLELFHFDMSKVTAADGMLNGFRRLLYAPYNVKIDIALETGWKDGNGNAVAVLPKDIEGAPMDPENVVVLYGPDLEAGSLGGGTYGNVAWSIDAGGMLTVSGTGDYMEPGTALYSEVPWYEYRDQITSAKITLSGATDLSYMFYGCSSLEAADLSGLDTSAASRMRGMFYNCANLGALDLSGFDTSGITDLCGMFENCSSLRFLDLRSFDTSRAEDMSDMFSNCSSLAEIAFGTEFDTYRVGNMSCMFAYCRSLEALDLSSFNVAAAGTMGYMFQNCSRLKSLDVSSFETVKAGSVYRMFSGCSGLETLKLGERFSCENVSSLDYLFYNCQSLKTLDLGGFKPARATSASYMLYGCKSLESLALTGFDTSNITDMSYMFRGCAKLASLDLSGFDTAHVTDMSCMFYDCTALTSLDVSMLEVSSVTDMSYMFRGCENVQSLTLGNDFRSANVTTMQAMFAAMNKLETLDLSGVDTSGVQNMASMFSGCKSLTSLDLSSFDTSAVTTMKSMFYDNTALREIKFGAHFDTGNVTAMDTMFYKCEALTALDLSSFDPSRVTTMEYMFYGNKNLKGITFGTSFHTGSATKMNSMFYNCQALTGLDVSGFDTSKVESFAYMFYGCSALATLDLRSFNTAVGSTMQAMFYNCGALTALDLSSFDTGNVTTMQSMFCGCKNLTDLDVSGFDTSEVTSMTYMFYGCRAIEALDLSSFDASAVSNADAVKSVFGNCSKLKTIFTPYNLPVGSYASLQLITSECTWYDAKGNTYECLPEGLHESIELGNGYKPDASKQFMVQKTKTEYEVNDVLDLDDLIVQYDGKALDASAYTTNAAEIDMTAPGEKTLVIRYKAEGGKRYSAELTIYVMGTISGSNAVITLYADSYRYEGIPIIPQIASVELRLSAEKTIALVEDKDYVVSGSNNIHVTEAEPAKVTIRGKGAFSGEADKTFTITKAPLTLEADESAIAVGETFESGLSYTVRGLLGMDKEADVMDDGNAPVYLLVKTASAQAEADDITAEAAESNVGRYKVKISGGGVRSTLPGRNYEITDWQAGMLTVVPDAGKKVSYTVTFDPNGRKTAGGTMPSPIRNIYAGSLIEKPSKEPRAGDGYVFTGWYRDDACESAWDFEEDVVAEDTVLYAGWAQKAKDDGLQFAVQEIKNLIYTGSAQKPAVKVFSADGKKLLQAGVDYTVAGYRNNVNADDPLYGKSGGSNSRPEDGGSGFCKALPYVIIKGKGNYSGTVYINFHIDPKDISDGAFEAFYGKSDADIPADAVNGTAPDVTLVVTDQLAKAGKAQKVFKSLKYRKNLAPGAQKDFLMVLRAVDAYDDIGRHLKTGAKVDMSKTSDTAPAIPKGYHGTFALTICGTYGAGNGYSGNYKGIIRKCITVAEDKAYLLAGASVTLGKNQKSVAFDSGKPCYLTPGWYDEKGKKYYKADGALVIGPDGSATGTVADKNDIFLVKIGRKYLLYGRDYLLEYRDNCNVGTATMKIVATGAEYIGSKEVAFGVKGEPLSPKTVSVERFRASEDYTGAAVTQNDVLLVSKGEALRYGTDYTISYAKNVKAGKATVTFTAKAGSKWSGSFKQTFSIKPAALTAAVLSGSAGSEDRLLQIAPALDGDTLTRDENNSTDKITVYRLRGSAIDYRADGTMPGDRFTLVNTRLHSPLVPGADYALSYANHRAITPASPDGRFKMPCMTLTGKGNYTGKIQILFSIDPVSVTPVAGRTILSVAAAPVPYKASYAGTFEYQPKLTVKDGKATLKGVLQSVLGSAPEKGKGADYTYSYVNCDQNTVKNCQETLRRYSGAPQSYLDDVQNGIIADERPYVVISADGIAQGSGKYKGTIEKNYLNIYQEDRKLSSGTVYIVLSGNMVYNDSDADAAIKPDVAVYFGSKADIRAARGKNETRESVLTGAQYNLTKLTQSEINGYTLTYGSNDKAGKNLGTVTITGTGLYGGSIVQKFTIKQKDIYAER